jgi:protoheme IX farnesyltransferase
MPERQSFTSIMPSEGIALSQRWYRVSVNYVRVLKPKETLLLWFIGLCSALVAAGGHPSPLRFMLVALVVLIGSGGTNGLTNYLDRHVDVRMARTRHRVLASGLVSPAWKGLVWSCLLVIAALGIAYYLHPYAFFAGLAGVLAAVIARKTWVTHFLGAISSTGPVLVAWFSIKPQIDATVGFLTLIVLLWVPVHVWNLMLAWRDDYVQAGVNIFPLTRGLRLTQVLSLGFSLAMLASVFLLWWLGDPGRIYLVMAAIAGVAMVVAGIIALWKPNTPWTFRVFKISAYPFLGMTFLGLIIDTWLRVGP